MKEQRKAERVYDTVFKEEVTEILQHFIDAYGQYREEPEEGEEQEPIQITFATNGDLCSVSGSVQYGWQSGDNSYTGGAYGYSHWGIGYVDDESDAEEIANEIIEQLSELLAYEDLDC